MPRVTKIIPPVYFGISIGLMLVLNWLKPWGEFDLPAQKFIGALLFVAGLGVVWYCDRMFSAAQTPIKPFHVTTTLIQEGPYAHSRNPIYASGVAALLGVALIMGTFSSLLVVVVFALLLHYGFVLAEEKVLRENMGETYQQYSERVRRWL